MKYAVWSFVAMFAGCAVDMDAQGTSIGPGGGKADGFCYGPETAVNVIPPQWPPSRIGDPIAEYVPSSLGTPSREMRNGDEVTLFWTSPSAETAELAVSYEGDHIKLVSSRHADGASLSLWGEAGYIYWEQRSSADGTFENSFDQDRNGYIDDLRTGVTGCLEHSYRLSNEASAKQSGRDAVTQLPPAEELTFPHAEVLESRSLVIAWDREIERATVSFRVLWSELVPALPADVVTNVSEVRVPGNWLAGAESVETTIDSAGFSFRATGVAGSVWGTSPVIEVIAPGATEEVALFSPMFVSDDTINQRESASDTVEAVDKQIAYLETELDQARAAVANPTDINSAVLDDIDASEARIAELTAQIGAARPDIASRWDSATREAQTDAVDAIQGIVSGDQRQQLDALLAQLALAAVPSSELAEQSRDLVLAALLGTQGEPSHVFVLLVTERQELTQLTLPELRQTLEQANASTVAYYEQRIEDFTRTLDDAKALRRNKVTLLNRLERAPSLSLLSTRHKPYTF